MRSVIDEPCIVSRDLGRYLDQMDADEARADALNAELDNALADVPDEIEDVIRSWLGGDPEFEKAIDAALERIIAARNAP